MHRRHVGSDHGHARACAIAGRPATAMARGMLGKSASRHRGHARLAGRWAAAAARSSRIEADRLARDGIRAVPAAPAGRPSPSQSPGATLMPHKSSRMNLIADRPRRWSAAPAMRTGTCAPRRSGRHPCRAIHRSGDATRCSSARDWMDVKRSARWRSMLAPNVMLYSMPRTGDRIHSRSPNWPRSRNDVMPRLLASSGSDELISSSTVQMASTWFAARRSGHGNAHAGTAAATASGAGRTVRDDMVSRRGCIARNCSAWKTPTRQAAKR